GDDRVAETLDGAIGIALRLHRRVCQTAGGRCNIGGHGCVREDDGAKAIDKGLLHSSPGEKFDTSVVVGNRVTPGPTEAMAAGKGTESASAASSVRVQMDSAL